MPARDLEVEIMMRGRRAAGPFDLHADPDNTPALREYLREWLSSEKYAPGMWGRFSLDVRIAGEWRIRKSVRT